MQGRTRCPTPNKTVHAPQILRAPTSPRDPTALRVLSAAACFRAMSDSPAAAAAGDSGSAPKKSAPPASTPAAAPEATSDSGGAPKSGGGDGPLAGVRKAVFAPVRAVQNMDEPKKKKVGGAVLTIVSVLLLAVVAKNVLEEDEPEEPPVVEAVKEAAEEVKGNVGGFFGRFFRGKGSASPGLTSSLRSSQATGAGDFQRTQGL